MRSFKKVWSEFANPKTGYLERAQFAKFFSVRPVGFLGCSLVVNFLFQRLNGVFEVRIYPMEYNVRNILSVCQDPLDKRAWRSRVVEGVDLTKLEQIVDGIDFTEIRKRRALYSHLYHEASISHEHGLGMSFSDMLTLLAHHKLILDAEALV